MNFTEIATPADLINENSKESTYEIAEKAAGELTYAEGKALAMYLLSCLGSMHDGMVKEQMGEGEVESAIAWSKDEQKLHTAWELLNSVQID